MDDIFTRFTKHVNSAFQEKESQDNSNPRKRYLKAVKILAVFMGDIAASNSFATGLSIIKSSQLHHIKSLADSPDEQKRAIAAMETLEIGEKHYEVLRDHPDIYRDLLAPGYLKKDRLPPDRILPKDGMHLALESHEKHVLARFSPLLAVEEKDWVASQITLVRGMRQQYNAMQKAVLGIRDES